MRSVDRRSASRSAFSFGERRDGLERDSLEPAYPPERDWSQPRFLLAGSNWELANGVRVVEAFQLLWRARPEATLDVVGRKPTAAMQTRASSRVRFHGALDPRRPRDFLTLRELRAQTTCFVLPLTAEPVGVPYLEAAAAGIGSIGSVDSASGRVTEAAGLWGIVVDPTDVDAIGDAMLHFCDPDTAREFGRRAWEHSRRFGVRGDARRRDQTDLGLEGQDRLDGLSGLEPTAIRSFKVA